MPVEKKYRCINCGKRFEIDVLTKEEAEERRRENKPTYAIHCPECNRTDIRESWE